MGAGQPADAGPADGHVRLSDLRGMAKGALAHAPDVDAEGATRFALWSDGTLHIQRPRSGFVLTVEETRELVRYLDAICLDATRGEGGT